MKYSLVKNNLELLLGPMDWDQYSFQMALLARGIVVTLPINGPSFVLSYDKNLKIFPTEVVDIDIKVDEIITGSELTFEENVLYYIPLKTKLSAKQKTEKIQKKREELKTQLRSIRKIQEESGVTVTIADVPCVFATDRESQGMMSRTLQYISTPINWKLKNGSWIVVSKEYMEYAIIQMGKHIQATFDKEETLSKKLDSLDLFGLFEINLQEEWDKI